MSWVPTPEEEAEEREFRLRYGEWDALTPTEVVDFLAGYDSDWWLVGGWAIEAFTGVARRHEDIDVVIWRRDVARFRDFVGDRHHLWSAGSGLLRPLDDDFPEPHPETGQIWVRDDASSPWFLDCILQDDRAGEWQSKRDPEHAAPLHEVTWVAEDGIRHLRPEIVLLHKARAHRPKDHADLRTTLPLLDEASRRWLRDAVRRLYPDHPWLAELG